jgi:hypothetical protein
MGQVVDVVMPKALPTSEIVVNMDGGVGGSWRVEEPEVLPQIKLPERQQEPFRLSETNVEGKYKRPLGTQVCLLWVRRKHHARSYSSTV